VRFVARAPIFFKAQMATSDDITAIDAAIVSFATQGFASVSIGGQTVSVKSLTELMDYRDRLKAQQAAANSNFGLRFTKLTPPGCG
jgi:hypothetical protein